MTNTPEDDDPSRMTNSAMWVDLQEVKFATKIQGWIIVALVAAVVALYFR